jgi:hypothetical protein
MDHDEVGIQGERGPIRRRRPLVRPEHSVGDVVLAARGRQLQCADRRVEFRVADDDLPRRIDSHVLHHGHEPVQDFRRPTAIAAGIHVDEPSPPQPLG